MEGHVTNRQLMFIIFLVLESYSVIELPKTLAESAGTGAWLPIVIAALFFCIAAAVIIKLGTTFQGKTLFEYSGVVAGKFCSYAFALIYLCYFFGITAMLLRSTGEVVKADFLTETPIWANSLLMLCVAGYAAAKGIASLGRLAEYFGAFIISAAVIIQGLMYVQGDALNTKPLFSAPLLGEYLDAVPLMILPFLGLEVLTVIPLTKKNGCKAKWYAISAVLAVAALYIIVVYTTYMALGVEDTKNYNDALVVAIRRIDLEFLQILKRIDVLFIIAWMWAMFCTFSILIFAVCEYVKKLIPETNGKLTTAIICLLLWIAALLPQNYSQVSSILTYLTLYFGLVPSFIIPLVLLIITKVKKYDKKVL